MSQRTKIPAYSAMIWPTVVALRELGGSGSVQEIYERVTKIMNFSEDQQGVLHTGGPETEIQYRLAWARTYLRKVGALENSERGVWAITDKGQRLTEDHCSRIPAQVRKMAPSTRGGRKKNESQDSSHDNDEESWKDELIEGLLAMAPAAFERLSQRLLREAGFQSVEVTGTSGDGGIDGTGFYRISLVSFPVFFQCKRYRSSVGADKVRDFRGAMAGRGDKGLLITTANFTSAAREEATRPGAPPIDLIDGEKLCDLLKDYKLGISAEVRTIEAVTVNHDFFKSI